jgi:hypothetical protein
VRANGRETQRRNKSEGRTRDGRDTMASSLSGLARSIVPSRRHVRRAETEYVRWDPKDGELCLSRAKPEETLVEVRSGSDVQIDRQTWV